MVVVVLGGGDGDGDGVGGGGCGVGAGGGGGVGGVSCGGGEVIIKTVRNICKLKALRCLS